MTNPIDRKQRRIDQPGDGAGASVPLGSGGDPLGAAIAVPLPPTGFVITGTAVLASAVTPQAIITLAWDAPASPAYTADTYRVQWAQASNFAGAITESAPGTATSATLAGLPAGTAVWVRIAAVRGGLVSAWSSAVTTTTASDTTPPGTPTGLSASWARTGDLTVTWANPTSPNLRDVRLQIYNNSGKSILYGEIFSATGRYVWPLALNLIATSNNPVSSVYLEARARSWSGVLSVSSATLTTTKTAPAQPGAVTADFAGPDCGLSWPAAGDATAWRVTLRDKVYTVTEPRFTYTYAQNEADGSGTAIASLPYSIRAIDALGLTSSARTGTATNAAPAATTLSVLGGFSELAVSITPSPALDLRHYEVRVRRDATLIQTVTTRETLLRVAATGSGAYTADVRVVDVFEQASAYSAQSSPATLEDQAQFAASLRAGAIYSNSIGTDPATLKAVLSDGRVDNAIPYPVGALHWTDVRRDVADRYQPILVHIWSSLPTVDVVILTSMDGVTWRNFGQSGGVVTEFAGFPPPGTAITISADTDVRIDLPGLIEARIVRLYHFQASGEYAIAEFYPERVVEGDLIRAASIKTLALAAGAVTADKITVTSLSALSANLGTITAGTVTGATIRTAASGQRVELDSTGLRTYNSAGQVQVEATTATNGELRAGQGAVVLDREGVRIAAIATASNERSYGFTDGGEQYGNIGGYTLGGTTRRVFVISEGNSEKAPIIELTTITPARVVGSPNQTGGSISLTSLVSGTPPETVDLRLINDFNPEPRIIISRNLYRDSTRLLTTRRTGWAAPTGTATRTAFATSTVTTAQLAERVKALIDDLIAHGLIGP